MNSLGGIYRGEVFEPDAIFTLSDRDFVAIFNGDEDPQTLFMEVRPHPPP